MRHIGRRAGIIEEASPVRASLLLRWSVAASLRGFSGLSTFLLELDLLVAGLGRVPAGRP